MSCGWLIRALGLQSCTQDSIDRSNESRLVDRYRPLCGPLSPSFPSNRANDVSLPSELLSRSIRRASPCPARARADLLPSGETLQTACVLLPSFSPVLPVPFCSQDCPPGVRSAPVNFTNSA